MLKKAGSELAERSFDAFAKMLNLKTLGGRVRLLAVGFTGCALLAADGLGKHVLHSVIGVEHAALGQVCVHSLQAGDVGLAVSVNVKLDGHPVARG